MCIRDSCNDNNVNLPTTPGTSCNDNNSNTSNDVILSDGCTCQGTTVADNTGGSSTEEDSTGESNAEEDSTEQSNTGTCSDINISTSANTISIIGLTAPIEIMKIYRVNNGWQLESECAANCGMEQIIANLTPGTYVVEVQFFTASWSSICSEQQTIVVSGIDSEGSSTPSFLIGNGSTLNQHTKPVKFDLYPNPAQEKIWLNLSNWEEEVLGLKIINHLAQEVVQYSINHQEGIVHPIEVPSLVNGLHFVQISNGTQTLTKKLFISK